MSANREWYNHLVRKIFRYLNPLAHLGDRKYSILFPLVANILLIILSEVFAYNVAKNSMVVGNYIIFLDVAFIIYFSFRDAVPGGVISTILSILYYFYIIYTRHYSGQQADSGIETTIILAVIYLLLSFIIGILKQNIDRLIEIQADERKRLETIIQQLPVGVIITDNMGKVIHINRQVDKTLNVKIPIGFRIGKDTLPKAKVNGQTIDPTQAPSFNVLSTGKPVLGQEIFFEHKKRKKVYLQINSAPVHNVKNKIIAVATIINDVTQRKELEKQKDDFLSMASHEFKTPITSMKMFIDLQYKQLKTSKDSKALYYNDRIRDQANRLKELSNDLLDVSRIQTGKLRFSLEEFDLTQVIKDTVEGLQGTTKHHEIKMIGFSKQLITGDRFRIYQVLVNLISNAIKYSPQGKKIIIRIKKGKRTVIISVQDFGIGIEKEQQSKVFDRLYQVTDPEEKTFPGLGLGLYISKEIIQRHGGKIWVESEKGKGSIFYFSLPLISLKR